MMRFLSSTTLSSANISSEFLSSAARRFNANPLSGVAAAVLVGGMLAAGPTLAGSSHDDSASVANFSYSQVEADPLAPVAALAPKPGATEDTAAEYAPPEAEYTPPEYDGVRSIEINMAPSAFNAKSIEVYAGETVRFVLRNTSPKSHEFTVGTPDMQRFRRRFMGRVIKTAHQDIASDERESLGNWNAVVVLPGETRELVWTFDKTENVEFGCNIHGHYEAGMKGHFEPISTEETVTADTSTAVPAAPEISVASETSTPETPAATSSAPAIAAAEPSSPETQVTIISPAAITSATQTPARLEPGLDIISPNISLAEFAALINSESETPAPDTAEMKTKEVKTAALSLSVSDASALDSGPDSVSRKTVPFASGTLPDNSLDVAGVRRTALLQTAKADIQADPQSDSVTDQSPSQYGSSQPVSSQTASSQEEPSLQELARLQSARYEPKQQDLRRPERVRQKPTRRVQVPSEQLPRQQKPESAAIPKPMSRLAALNTEGLSDESPAIGTPARKKFAVLSIRNHMRMGRMREQALLSRSLELRLSAPLTLVATAQLSVPVRRNPGGTAVNFSSKQYGGSEGRYLGEISEEGEREVRGGTIRRISDSTIRTLDDAGDAILRTAGSLFKRVGLDGDGAGEFGEGDGSDGNVN